jgi:hypothetical protein
MFPNSSNFRVGILLLPDKKMGFGKKNAVELFSID